jgi:hypothetical protein
VSAAGGHGEADLVQERTQQTEPHSGVHGPAGSKAVAMVAARDAASPVTALRKRTVLPMPPLGSVRTEPDLQHPSTRFSRPPLRATSSRWRRSAAPPMRGRCCAQSRAARASGGALRALARGFHAGSVTGVC